MAEANSNGNGNIRWSTWAAMCAVVFPILGFAIWVGTLQSEIRTTAQAQADQQVRIERLVDIVNTNRAQIGQLCSGLVEVETQFRAADQVRNLMQMNNLRNQAEIYRKAFGVDYPDGMPYLPTIAQDEPNPCK